MATIVIALAALIVTETALASPPFTKACQAPPLLPPGGTVVQVSTESQLQAAVRTLTSGTTVLIQPGTYNLTSTLGINSGVQNVAIRGATNSCDDVILIGRGMTNSNHGGVPHGIWIGNAQQVLIANLTIRDVYHHPIQLDPNLGAQAPHIYNVHLIDAGAQFIKSSASATGTGVNNGIVEYSIMEYTTTAPSWYTQGVDVHQGANWVIRHNLFRNIATPPGQRIAGPAVLMWNGSRDTIVEANLFLNVQYGIALGLDPNKSNDHLRGIIRNNFFHRSSSQSGDVGITINNSAGTKVLNNTVIVSGTYPNAIEYRFPVTTGVDIRYNLTDGAVKARDGATGTVSNNVTDAQPGWFVNAFLGDLRLTAVAIAAIDQAQPHPAVTTDYDDESRPIGPAPDIGADEFGAAPTGVPPSPSNLTVIP